MSSHSESHLESTVFFWRVQIRAAEHLPALFCSKQSQNSSKNLIKVNEEIKKWKLENEKST